MKILVVGGGSGGHITPVLAVIREILNLRSRSKVEFWTDFKYFRNVTRLTTELGVSTHIAVHRIPAGKFHRYADWAFRDFFDHFDITIKDLIFGNIFGFFKFIAGIIVSFSRLFRKKTRPDIIFLKGGYVCLPVGLIARLFKIPYIIHESDSVAGLANRLLMKQAKFVAFGMPLSDETKKSHPNYVWTGIPVGPEFKAITPTRMMSLKKAFSFNPEKPLVVITGGSQGSKNLDETTRLILPELLKFASVGLVAGRKYYEDMIDLKDYENWDHASLESNFRMWEFSNVMDEVMGAADVIVSRAGATTVAELASLKKAIILVPFEALPNSHQLRNAERLADSGSAIMIKDADMMKNPSLLLDKIRRLIRSPRLRADLADRLHEEARSDAALRLAKLILGEE